jgi:hypothetical protein
MFRSWLTGWLGVWDGQMEGFLDEARLGRMGLWREMSVVSFGIGGRWVL